MRPALEPGDTLLGTGWFRPRVGQIVVVRYKGRLIIKRITQMDHRRVWIEGDNSSASTDSRHFGPVHDSTLKARVVRKL